MKNKKLDDLKNEKNSDFLGLNDCELFGFAGLFFLWYVYKELEKEAIKEYLEEQKLINELSSEYDNEINDELEEDLKILVKKK